MGFASVLLIAFGLAADCFAVSLSGSVAMKGINWRQVARVSIVFGLFQGLMPVIGWLAGRAVVDFIAAYDHLVGLRVAGLCRRQDAMGSLLQR